MRQSRKPPGPVPASRSVPCGSPGRQLWPVGLFCSPWPEQALRANIHCQISLALNRIYTEWYPSKGYTFNITNSTSYDQYYVHGRTVFEVMVRITDDIFNTYLRKRGTVNPYYSEYCDGKSVTCPGLKQWGTVTLANNGRSALQILRYYYGSDIEIVRTSNIQSIPQSYPGSPLRQGDSGTAVFTLQRQLNRITKDYPFLGKLTVDGVFGSRMAATVRAFQKQFNLTADGVVGRQTWYKISYIYVSVKDLAELTSEGETSSGTLSDGSWGGTALRTGSTGSAVEQVQFWLNTLAQYESAIPSLAVDGRYGVATASAVFLEHGGAPEKAFRSAFVNQINAYLKANNKYSKNDGQINIQDVEDCIIFVVSSFSTQTSYENQTKKAITNKFIQEAMTDFFRKQLEVYFIENKMDADKISNQVLINMRARIKAENTRKTLKTSLQSKMDMTNRIQKFVDCRSKDVDEREVFIVEGDSALGACKQARDASFQAIMPVRGKILNCLKSDYDKIFKSEIITDLIKVLGCGVEVKSKAAKDLSLFDINNLRWSKILICTDADVDGFHIRTLILTMIYRLMPKIIEAGKVYIAESPLYEVTCKDQTYFAYNEKEMDEIKEEIGDQKYTVQRSKGLGENEAEMMALTTMNPKTRRLIKVTPDDAQKTSEMFDLLLGDNLEGRKEYISDYGHLYLDAADVS